MSEAELRAKLRTFQSDPRYPHQNQTHRCFQNYVDYHRCVNSKGEDFGPCKEFWRTFQAMCPSTWIAKFDEQREAGIFPAYDV